MTRRRCKHESTQHPTLDLLFLNCLSAARSSGRMLPGVMPASPLCRDDEPPEEEAEMKD